MTAGTTTAVCGCRPIRKQCGEFAASTGQSGVWSGHEYDRGRLLRESNHRGERTTDPGDNQTPGRCPLDSAVVVRQAALWCAEHGLTRGQEPVSVAFDYGYGYGPYTVEDLHALPDEGKSYELVDGWLIELSPSTRHDYLGQLLWRILERAAEDCGAAVYVQAPMDISTPAGARKPDVAVMAAAAARNARDLGLSLYPGADVMLAVEIVSRGSGSEREDRGRKVIEYARTGIAHYWLVDFDPRPRIQLRTLQGDRYSDPIVLDDTAVLELTDPFPIAFPVARLGDYS
jgi:hypothetical protein